MNSRQLFVLLVLGVLLALKLLAQADPPDQTWIEGFYDDADYDDVLFLVTEGLSEVQSDPLPTLPPVAAVVGFVLLSPSHTVPKPFRPSKPSRAPPLA